MLTLFLLFSIFPWPYLHHYALPPPSSSTIPIHPFDCLFSSLPPSPYPLLSCQGVYISPSHSRVPNKVERIRGEKTVLLPAMVSLSFSISSSFSFALTVDIFQLMYSWPLAVSTKMAIYILHIKGSKEHKKWRQSTFFYWDGCSHLFMFRPFFTFSFLLSVLLVFIFDSF